MIRILRLAAGLAAAVLFAGLLLWLQYVPPATDPPPATGARRVSIRNPQCEACHPRAWQEWHDSPHARSWSTPEVQAAFQHFGNDRKCESCHAPEPLGGAVEAERIQLRAEDRESGVNCLTCHLLPDGSVAALQSDPRAACRPVVQAYLAESRMCGSCHTATFQDWQGSRYEAAGQSCQACHMRAADAPDRVSHLCAASTNPEMIRSGVRMTSQRQGERLRVEVTNHATGHNFPGERHHRVLALEVIQRTADGKISLARREVIKDVTPFRGESSAEQIPIDGVYRAEFPVDAEAASAEVKLLYKRFPWQPDWQSLVVHREELTW